MRLPLFLLVTSWLSGCNPCGVVWNDKCEKLCCQVSRVLEECENQNWAWSDIGALDKDDFTRQCFQDWDDITANLTTYENQQAVEVCDTTLSTLVDDADLTCDDVLSVYLQASF